ncbi:hypothetical protein EG329_011942 [Mollisiaceae sp. DMI_Dod_QoI]|nr:hypothetical protein EG329_011942 [Helotiales sp. DMI_Dod_QoI]
MLESLGSKCDGMSTFTKLLVLAILIIQYFVFKNILRIKGVPGPKLYALTKWRLAYDDWTGTRTRAIHRLHQEYGPVVRIGPNEISFNSLSALKTIYGAGSGFERTSFYRMFDVYGHQNLFTFATVKAHGERKKLLNHAYSKSSILKVSAAAVERKVWEYMRLLETAPKTANETFASLHYYSLDNITHFLYGEEFGATSALTGSIPDRTMLDDVLDPSRRKLAWFAAHLPRYTKWLMSRTGFAEDVVAGLGLLPQKKPTVYTGIRKHALTAWETYSSSSADMNSASKSTTIIGRLGENQVSKKTDGLQDMEIASEAADHLLAGVDTTSDTLMFLIWALSLPENLHFQDNLIKEVLAMPESDLDTRGIPTADATGKLPYLDAVIKETLRLYAPLPASEPRSLPANTTIDGFDIPANTVVSMSPYNLHRNPEVFRNPLVFNPERWFGEPKEVTEMKKWFWAFSSGGRMCIGIHLAMAEMTTLTAAIYRIYRTKVKAGTEDTSPGITSRFEVFYDETKPRMKEHECWIDFEKQVR